MSWRAINQTHAIERVRFTLKFKQVVPEKLARQVSTTIESYHADERLVGPIPSKAVQFGVQLDDQGKVVIIPTPAGMTTWQFARNSPQGVVLEVIGVEGDKIVYESTTYTRWQKFRDRFEKVVLPVIELASRSLDTELVSLEYVDRFIFDGPVNQAVPTQLLRGLDTVLHADALSGRTMWHYHKGWFQAAQLGDLLINQNFDAVDSVAKEGADAARSVSVLTKAEARAGNFRVDDVQMLELLDLFHKVTKIYFREALNEELHQSIGLN